MEPLLPGQREGLEDARRNVYTAFFEGRIDADAATARLLAFARYARHFGPDAVGRRLGRESRSSVRDIPFQVPRVAS